jgi:hypothetical protein
LGSADIKRLGAIAALLDAEAGSWKEGFAGWVKGQWVWDGEYPEIHARVIRLESAAHFLRRTQRRLMKKENA